MSLEISHLHDKIETWLQHSQKGEVTPDEELDKKLPGLLNIRVY